MTTTTVTLERSAYERLKSVKRSKESFSDTVLRLLEPNRPSLRGFLEIFSEADANAIGKAIEHLRAEDLAFELVQARKERRGRGRRN
ncbi:MAG: antitoxin VapB family protein [Thermoplasmata archaeon]